MATRNASSGQSSQFCQEQSSAVKNAGYDASIDLRYGLVTPPPSTNSDTFLPKKERLPHRKFNNHESRRSIAPHRNPAMYNLALPQPQSLQGLMTERSYLLNSLQREDAHATALLSQHSFLTHTLSLLPLPAGREARRLQWQLKTTQTRLHETTKQEKSILNRLGQITFEIQSRERRAAVEEETRSYASGFPRVMEHDVVWRQSIALDAKTPAFKPVGREWHVYADPTLPANDNHGQEGSAAGSEYANPAPDVLTLPSDLECTHAARPKPGRSASLACIGAPVNLRRKCLSMPSLGSERKTRTSVTNWEEGEAETGEKGGYTGYIVAEENDHQL